ncbi:hypothetical protein BU25DRAFT_382017 [Macroventuria anomochaeta]|uniref:Uncharacterized protein n=1 Tax=Macroventuria anomochaeta TaxID=301207 RepID=A0ACB6SEW1_9PLEO|nr:uncharacterized protein BU25DRAFT_382017 [Macroventuria anomochaeta]KAF2632522.1 hypothetical protein BU25DRAFT_382017 [Macroventuria anomochaeta]
MPSKERETADKLVAAYNAMDVDTIIALRTPDCKRVFLPSSLKYLPQSNEFFKQNLLAISAIFTSFKLEEKRIVMYVSAFGESPMGDYRNQYVWKMGFTSDGSQISSWSEFVDVGVARDFYPLLKREMVRRAEAAEGKRKGDELGQAVRGHYMGMQGGEGGVR